MLRVATRGSALARWQAARVVELLGTPAHEFVIVTTTGDRRTDAPIHTLGGQGVFVKEVQQAVRDGRADIAVHSAKDLPAVTPDDLVLAAIPERADARDALVGARLDDIPVGGSVGTGAVRRRAQVRALRPDLTFGELRGNVDTRIAKAAGFDAVVIAAAALERLGQIEVASEVLPLDVMVPQVGQGALAVECRAADVATRDLLATIDDSVVHKLVDIERAFLAHLGGGCDLPVGAHARTAASGAVVLRVFVETDGAPRSAEVEGDAGELPDALVGRAFEAIGVAP